MTERSKENHPYHNISQNTHNSQSISGHGTRQPTINLQIYEQQPIVQSNNQQNIQLPPSLMPQFVGPYPHPLSGYQPNYSYTAPIVPVINNYKINATGPMDNHTKLSTIYEDILPAKQFMTTINTLDERIHLYEFVRSVLIKEKQDMMVLSHNQNSLLNYIKFMDLNPYNTNIFSSNPYLGLPNDMLLYRSCYPIRSNPVNSTIICAKNSTAVNIRIYKVTDQELTVFYNKNPQITQQLKQLMPVINGEIMDLHINDYNIWREIAYYEFVREEIIKKRISPNFVMMYMYNIALTPFIDYIRLAQMRGQTSKIDSKPKSLVVITESPTHNLYGWASNAYKQDFNIKKMVHTGYYSEKIWFGILFQLMTALYTMQKYGFMFNEFSIEDHVYIKDLPIDASNIKYWKYKINNIEYYLPNYGYLVVIDSKYKDIMQNHMILTNGHKGNHKIYGEFLGDCKKQIHQQCYETLKLCITKNSFGDSFKNNGGVMPPDIILNFLERMNTEFNKSSNTDISYYIEKLMTQFMHNRIGTLLKESVESKYIRKEDTNNFSRGEMIVYEYSNENYKFVMYEGKDHETEGNHNVFYKENTSDKDIILKSVPGNKIYKYSAMEIVTQNYRSGEVNFNEDNLLETYNI